MICSRSFPTRRSSDLQAIAAEEMRLYHVRFRLHKAESVLNFLFGCLTWLIGLRMILEFLSADPAKFVVKATYSRSEEHTSELQSPCNLVCRLLLEKKK